MIKVYLELFTLFSGGFSGKDLVDELEMGCLHDLYDPTEVELDS